MALTRQHIDLIPTGLNTKVDPKIAPAGVVTEAQNVYRTKAGEYRRRKGRASVSMSTVPSGAAAIPNIWQLATYKDNLVALTKLGTGVNYPTTASDGELFVSTTRTPGSWAAPAGSGYGTTKKYPIFSAQSGPLTSTRRQIDTADAKADASPSDYAGADLGPDVAIIAGSDYAVVVAADAAASTIAERIINYKTGATLFTFYYTGSAPHVEAVPGATTPDNSVTVAYADGSNIKLRTWKAASVPGGVPTSGGTPVSVSTGAQSSGTDTALDTVVVGSQMAIGVRLSAKTKVHVAVYTPSTATVATHADVTVDCNGTIGFLRDFAASGRILLGAASDSSGLLVKTLSTALALVATWGISTTVDGTWSAYENTNGDQSKRVRNVTGFTTSADSNPSFIMLWDVDPDKSSDGTKGQPYNTKTRIYDTSQVDASATDFIRSVGLRSKCFVSGADVYVVVGYDSTVQPTYFVVRVPAAFTTMTEPKPRCAVTKIDMWRGNGKTERLAGLSNVSRYTIGAGIYWLLAATRQVGTRNTVKASTGGQISVPTTGIDLITLAADSVNMGRPVEFADQLVVPQGQVCGFDGAYFEELGFPLFPEQPQVVSSASTGGMIRNSTYSYCAVYRHTDAQGRVHRSAPSVPVSGSPSSTGAIRIIAPALRLWGGNTGKEITSRNLPSDIVVELYRTTANGSTYYLLAEIENYLSDARDFAVHSSSDVYTYDDLQGDITIGTITVFDQASIVDGWVITINDGIHAAVVFEFDVAGDGVGAPGDVGVNISSDVTASDVAKRLADAINTVAADGRLNVLASWDGTDTIRLTSTFADPTRSQPTLTITPGHFASSVKAGSDLQRATLLYTTGGILPNHSPPQLVACCVHRDRLWGISADDPQELWYSKQVAPGLGPQFTDAFVLRIDDEFGPCTGLASMDDKLVIFKKHAIYVVMGDGPDNLGNGVYAQPHRIGAGSDVGALSARSVITTPEGVWFNTINGIYHVDRGLNVVAHREIQDFQPGLEGVVDAVYLGSLNQLRLYTGAGACLVYDTYFQQWYYWTGQTSVAACYYNNGVAQVSTSNGYTVDYDFGSYWQDAGASYQMRVAWSWLALAGLSGFQRLYEIHVLGDSEGATTVAAKLAYDYREETAETLHAVGVPLATGTVICCPPSAITEGQTLTISDGSHTPTVFEFTTGTESPGNVKVDLTGLLNEAYLGVALAAAINSVGSELLISATDDSLGTVTLTADAGGPNRNVAMTTTITASGFSVSGMSGGGGPFRARIKPSRQKCSAIEIAVEDDSPNTEGIRLTGIAAIIGIKGPGQKLPAGNTMAP